jgi:hypothetical protein
VSILVADNLDLRADVKTDAEGRFSLESIASGNYFGFAQKQGFLSDSTPRFIAAGLGINGVDFVLTF